MRPPFLQDLASRLIDMPGWLRYGALFWVAAGLLGLCWWLLIQDLQVELSAAERARQTDLVRWKEQQAFNVRSKGAAEFDIGQHERLANLERLLVSATTESTVWAAVHRASRQHGLRMALFKPGLVGTEKPYPAQRTQLRLVGSFDALLGFTRDLAAEGGQIAIEGFSLAPEVLATGSATGGGSSADTPAVQLALDVTLLTLHRPAPADGGAPQANASGLPVAELQPAAVAPALPSTRLKRPPSVARDPFASQRMSRPVSAINEPATGLQAWPLTGMRMVGRVQTPERVAALVWVAGQLHAVGVGDRLGNGRGHVVAIQADRMTVREPSGAGFDAAPGRAVTLQLEKD